MRVEINATNFPDKSFRYYVSTLLDLAGDGYIDDDDIADVTSMRIPYSGNGRIGSYEYGYDYVYNLKGIEYFTELRSLEIIDQRLNNITLGSLKKLRSFSSVWEGVSGASVDFRGCDSLESITFDTELINATEENRPSHHSIYLNDSLKDFSFKGYSDGSLSFDFSNCSSITNVSIHCSGTPVISGLNNKTLLKTADISSTSTLDFSNDSSLESVSAKGSSLKSLNCSNCASLESVDCASSGVETVNCENCASLKSLLCGNCTSLSSLSITGCSNLETLNISYSAIRPSLDLREFKNLETLTVPGTNLSSLLLGEKPVLKVLECRTKANNIYVRKLDLNGCPLLRDYYVLYDSGRHDYDIRERPYYYCGNVLYYDAETIIEPINVIVLEGTTFTIRQNRVNLSSYQSAYYRVVNKTTGEEVERHSLPSNASNSGYFRTEATSDINGNLYYIEVIGNQNYLGESITYVSHDYQISVVEPPVITSQPESTVAAAGSTVSLSITAEYETLSDLTYQWERLDSNGDWINAAGESNSSTYQFVCSTYDNGSQYRCKLSVENWYDYSDIAAITIVTTPNISVHPASQVVKTGSTVVFSVSLEN